MKKRLLSALLAVCLMFGSAAALPEGYFGDGSQISASADSSQGYTYTVQSDGSAKITRADSTLRSQSTVTIPDTLDGHKVTVLGASNAVGIFAGLGGGTNTNIKTLTLPDTVKIIETSSLAALSALSTVNLNEGLTTINSGAFRTKTNPNTALKSITLPASLTNLSSSAFEGCIALSNIIVKSGNSSYCSEDGIVYNKSKTEIVLCPLGKTSVTIPETITSIPASAFKDLSKLSSVTIHDNVTAVGKQAFFGCTSLKKVTIPANVTSFGDKAFGYYKDPDSIDILKVSGFTIRGYKGSAAETYAKNNGFEFEEIDQPVHVHVYSDPVFIWAADNSSCTAKRVCKLDSSHVQTFTEASTASKKAATCNVAETTTYTAKFVIDGKSYTKTKEVTQGSALGHDWGSWTTTKDPTCTDTGTETRSCKRSGCTAKETRNKAALGHNYSAAKTVAPKCEEKGYTLYACSRCTSTYKDNYTDPKGHNYTSKTVKPTCTAQGYTLHTCSDCGKSYKDNYTAMTDHSWGDWKTTREATETTEGSKERSCTVCGKKETASIPKKSHTHSYKTQTVAPTCTEQGYTLHTCSGCGYSYKDNYKNALGHNWTDWEPVDAATCTADGKQTRRCQRSGCNTSETRIVTKLGHDYKETTVKPTCTAAGYTLHKCSRCSDSYKDDHKDALGHNYETTVVKPTCTAKGYTLHKCSRCGDYYKDTYTNTVDHSWSAWKTTKEATEKAEGSKERSCKVCGKKETEVIPKTTHKHTYTTKTIAPTCTSKGYTLHTCSGCGNTYEDNYKNALGHSFGEWKTTTEPTCTADGTQTRSCTRTGCTQKETRTVAKLGHSYTTKVVAPTCTAKGYTLCTCIRCGSSYKENYTAAVDHTWGEWKTIKDATEKTEGTKQRSCTVCGKKETDIIPKKPHVHSYTAKTIKPTCEAKGYTLHTCKGCGDNYVDNYKPALGHSWGKWKTTKAATETSTGSKERYCTVCNKKEVAVIPIKNHTHSYTKKVVAPTCTAKGYTLHTCKCGYSYKDNYKAALGHDWSKWTTTKNATCTEAGSKTRKCSRCGKTQTGTIAKLGHKYTVTTVAPTCTAKGYKLHKCSRCGKSYKDTYTAALGHKYTVTTVAPTCTAKGYKLHKCSRCGKSYKDTYKAALGHKWSAWETVSFNLKNNTSLQTRKCSRCEKVGNQTVSNAVTRLAGANRYETASIISAKMYKTADTVVLATGMTYHDALVAVPLASAYDAPLLLATERHITAQTEAELKRLKAKNIIVISTDSAIGANAKSELKALGLNVTYIEGKTCFETAAKTAKALQTKLKKAPETLFFATDSAYADALSASPVAAVKNAPIIYLKNTGSIDKATADYLKSVKGRVKNAYIIGGDGVISDAMMKNVAKALGLTSGKTVQRVWGKDRYATCLAVNRKFAKTLSGENLCVATGMDFPDALAGGVLAGNYKAPLLLVNGKLKTAKLTDEQIAYIKEKSSPRITVFGGTGAVPQDYIKLITG